MYLCPKFLGLVFLTLAGGAVQALGGTIYSQVSDNNGAYVSQEDSNGFGLFAQTYDNFTLEAPAEIDAVDWVGSYFDPQDGRLTGFTVSFYADESGQPGALLTSFTTTGNAGETYLGIDNIGDPLYSYGTPVNFNASAGTTFWLSIVADLGYPQEWGWETSSDGDLTSYQDFFGTLGQVSPDEAFTLDGNFTPEPFTFELLGAGFAVLYLAKFLRDRRGAQPYVRTRF
jgi:hypothetical protein